MNTFTLPVCFNDGITDVGNSTLMRNHKVSVLSVLMQLAQSEGPAGGVVDAKSKQHSRSFWPH